MSFRAEPGDALTYESFFGLTEKAFSLNADARFVYESPTFSAAREGLLSGIRRREGLLVLTGEIGTGKTTLCRTVLRDLRRKIYSSLVPDPFASREDLLKMLLIDFGALSIQELTTGSLQHASRTELSYLLSNFLESLPADAHVVVIIDEAQNLTMPLIEETRILADTFGADGRLQIVYVGQPELHAKLKLPEMRQVDQRVCGYHRLSAMSRDAVAGYVRHRLEAAGGDPERELFAPDVVDILHRRSGGVPRLINRVCDRSLQLAFERKVHYVNREILDAAMIEVGAVTLSPTWDSIVFADAPVSPLAPAAVAGAASDDTEPAELPDAAAPRPIAVEQLAELAVDEAEDFQKEIDHWVEKDLAPPSRTLTPMPKRFAETVLEPEPEPDMTPVPERRREAAARIATNDWPRDVRAETYMQRLLRVWVRRAVLSAGIFAFVGVASWMVTFQREAPAYFEGATIPEDAPTRPAPLGVLPAPIDEAKVSEALPAAVLPAAADDAATPAEAATAPPPPVVAEVAASAADEPGDYLVAVGLFASRDRADHLLDSLTQAGLPAMQQPFQLRGQSVQRIVLGPFFNRADAVAGLQRLHQLGGYDDARVIGSATDTTAQ